MLNNNLYPHLEKAPIILAILEIRFKIYSSPVNIDMFSKINHLINPTYPIFQKGHHRDIEIQEKGNGEAEANIVNSRLRDYLFFSKNKKTNFSISLEKFNFNLNGSYSSWEDFVEEAKRIWDIYYENIFKDLGIDITGIAIRYVNKIEINENSESVNTSDFLNTTIYAAEEVMPDPVNSYLIRYVVQKEEGVHINVTQSLEPSGDKVSFIFDIDTIMNKIVESDKLWDNFERLRKFKNDIFFSNLTEKTVNLLS